jgi:putative ABC transport system permease protein
MRSNFFRSLLTLLGVALAMGVVTAMLAIQAGTQERIRVMNEAMGGPQRFSVRSQSPSDDKESLQWSRSRGLRLREADSLDAKKLGVEAFRSAEMRLQVSLRSRSRKLTVKGVEQKTLETVEQAILEEGEFFSIPDYSAGTRVCVIGWLLAEELRKTLVREAKREVPLLGQALTLGGQTYTVMGVFTREFKHWNRPGWWVYIPLNAMRRDFTGGDPQIEDLTVQADSAEWVESRSERIRTLFKGLHRGAEDIDFRFYDWVKEFSSMMENLRLAFLAIASIAFMVSGVNLLNLMLSTLADRVREIGVRKALGATNGQILIQFLSEAATLSFCGGVLGCLLGLFPLAFADELEAATDGIRPQVEPETFVIVLALSIGIGILFGLFPAWKAARLNPVEALRAD